MVGPPLGKLDRGQDPVRDVREPERVGVDEQELLLDPDAERLAGAEGVARPAQLGGRRVDLGPLAHGVSPSAARAAMRPNTSAAASPLA